MKYVAPTIGVMVVVVITFAAVQLLKPPATLDDLLRHVPDDAALAIAFPSLTELDSDVTAFAASGGFTAPDHVSEYALAVLEIEDESLRRRVADKGPFVLAFRPNGDGPLALIGVRDTDLEPDVEELDIVENVLIYSRDTDWVSDAAQASGKFAAKFAAAAGPFDPSQNVVTYLETSPWQEKTDQWLFWFGSMATMASAAQGESMAGVIEWFMDTTRGLIEETNTAVLTCKLDFKNLRLSASIQGLTDGRMSKYLASVKKSDEPILRGLPAGDAMMIFGFDWLTPPDQPSLLEKASLGMLETEDASDNRDDLKEALKVYRAVSGQEMVMGMSPDDHIIITTFSHASDPQVVLADLIAASRIAEGLTNPMLSGLEVDYSESTEIIYATPVHVLAIDLEVDDPQVQGMMDAMYGGDMHSFFFAAKDGVFSVGGSEADARDRVAEMVKVSYPPLTQDARVQAAFKTLSPDPQAIFLMDFSQFVRMGAMMSRLAGMPDVELRMPEKRPPFVAGGLYLHPDSASAELCIPAEALRAIGDMALAGEPY